MAVNVYTRVLVKAAELLGGRRQLARRLQAPSAELERWIAGDAVPPMATFLKAVDVILDETPAPGGDSGEPPADLGCTPYNGAWT